jgi:hypothetical protein
MEDSTYSCLPVKEEVLEDEAEHLPTLPPPSAPRSEEDANMLAANEELSTWPRLMEKLHPTLRTSSQCRQWRTQKLRFVGANILRSFLKSEM